MVARSCLRMISLGISEAQGRRCVVWEVKAILIELAKKSTSAVTFRRNGIVFLLC